MEWLVVLMGSKRGAIAAIVCVVLAVALMGAGIALGVYDINLQAAKAERDAARDMNTNLAERIDSQGDTISALRKTNADANATLDELKELYDAQQAQWLEQERINAQAVAEAQAAAARAQDAARDWMNRYAEQVRQPDCAKALQHLEVACPALEGY